MPVEEAMHRLDARPDGLREEEAAARLRRHGANRLPEQGRPSVLRRFLRQFHDVLIYVLLVAGAVTVLLGQLVDASVIFGVVLINAIVGFVQEGRAEAAMGAIRRMLAPGASVLRDGHRHSIDAVELVPGDQVLLEPGDRVPADLRLARARGLAVQEAVLTGESVPADKGTEPVAAGAALGDRRSMAYAGTLVARGYGRGVVAATGGATEIGRVSGMLGEVETLETPLVRQMAVFARRLTATILALAAATIAFGTLVRGQPLLDMLLAGVGLAVAAIPEGLPAVMTIALAVGVRRMAARNAIVRRLPAVETLGSVSVICSDKTGTLTRNEMAVERVALSNTILTVTGRGYEPAGEIERAGEPQGLPAADELVDLARAALLCNDASLGKVDGAWRVEGDPMEGALVAFAMKLGLEPGAERGRWQRRDLIPFDATRRFMATLNQEGDGSALVCVKGAPEQLLGMCDSERRPDGEAPLDPEVWYGRMAAIAGEGHRLLALAARPARPDEAQLDPDRLDEGLVFLGLVGLVDPPRAEAIAAIRKCRAAGVDVKMITGDHAATALAIADRLGLATERGAITGADLDRLDDAELGRRAREVSVFARTSPLHKLRLVRALQAAGRVVAMTGDGVNDAPALKRADVGIAMGAGGTEAAKEAAEMVLADDNFATIAVAVEEGRGVYENLKKAIVFILPTNGGEALVLVAAILLGLELPITPVQILWVNMITAVTLALALAFEAVEPGIMRRPPRPAAEPLLSGFLIWRVVFVSVILLAGVFALFAAYRAAGADLAHARTIAVNALVLFQIFYLFNCRRLLEPVLSKEGLLGSRPVLLAAAIVLILQLAYTYLPPLDLLFATTPLGLADWAVILLVAFSVLLLVEAEKALLHRWRDRQRRPSLRR
jgi:magnesium-transporting ATPase (P-type)